MARGRRRFGAVIIVFLVVLNGWLYSSQLSKISWLLLKISAPTTSASIKAVDLQKKIYDGIAPLAKQFVQPLPLLITTKFSFPEGYPPAWTPFDARFTLLLLLDEIADARVHSRPASISSFHWGDYVDMSAYFLHGPESCVLFDVTLEAGQQTSAAGPFPIERFCVKDENAIDPKGKLRPGYRIFANAGRSSEVLRRLEGLSFLIGTMPLPHAVTVLVGQSAAQVAVNNPKHQQFVHDLDRMDLTRRRDLRVQLEEFDEFTRMDEPREIHYKAPPTEIKLELEDFEDPTDEMIALLEAQDQLNASDASYLEALKYEPEGKYAPKYFGEALLLKSVENYGRGTHYDWRFFEKLLEPQDEQIVMRGLIQTWLKLCRVHGLHTWLAHGTLLLWYWNGTPFPWDTDVDVQMPIRDLHKLARQFNQLVIIDTGNDPERPRYGRYYVDVATSIKQRVKGNGQNNIDARLIDLDTGVFIDITGLARAPRRIPPRYGRVPPPVFQCRNNHFLLLDELLPLKVTLYEGEWAYVPNKFSQVLVNEYKQKLLEKYTHQGHIFVDAIGFWIPLMQWHDFIMSQPDLAAELARRVDDAVAKLRRLDPNASTEQLELKVLSTSYPIARFPDVSHYQLFINENYRLLQRYLVEYPLTHLHAEEMALLLRNKKTTLVLFDKGFPKSEIAEMLSPYVVDYFTVVTNARGDSYSDYLAQFIGTLHKWDASA